MTQKEKDLLLQDLCARLPYGVKINFPSPSNEQDVVEKLRDVELRGEDKDILLSTTTWYNIKINECKPYLRPMESMTEEDKEQLHIELCDDIRDEDNGRHTETYGYTIVYHNYKTEDWYIPFESIDWLNAHHFDYRGLIPMGLALEAPEGMYND